MENMFIWMLVGAGAVVGLLGTLLLASEKELKAKNRRLEELESRIAGMLDPDAHETSTDGRAPQSPDDEALAKQNEALSEEISTLRSELEQTRGRIAELESVQAQASQAVSERDELSDRNRRLQDENTELRNGIEYQRIRLNEAEEGTRETAEIIARMKTEIASLNARLQETEAQLHAMEVAHSGLGELRSRESQYREKCENLTEQIVELKRELAVREQRLREADSARSRLDDLEQQHRQVQDDNVRLQQELVQLRERFAHGPDRYGQRMEAARTHLSGLQVTLAELTDRSRGVLDELVEIKKLLIVDGDRLQPNDSAETNDREQSAASAQSSNEPESSLVGAEEFSLQTAKDYLNAGRYAEALHHLEGVLERDPEQREARLYHLLASVRLHNVYGYESRIDALKDIPNLTDSERAATRDIFLIRADEAQKRGRDDEMLRYRAWAKNVVFRTSFGSPSSEVPAPQNGVAENNCHWHLFQTHEGNKGKKTQNLFLAAIAIFLIAFVMAAAFLRRTPTEQPRHATSQIEATPTSEPFAAVASETSSFREIPAEKSVAAQEPAAEKTAAAVKTPAPPLGETKGLSSLSTDTAAKLQSAKKATRTATPKPLLWGKYEIIQPTKVYSKPSEDSQSLLTLDPGIKVNVVDGRNGWLEIRSKFGRPPGFIKQETAVPLNNSSVTLAPNRKDTASKSAP